MKSSPAAMNTPLKPAPLTVRQQLASLAWFLGVSVLQVGAFVGLEAISQLGIGPAADSFFDETSWILLVMASPIGFIPAIILINPGLGLTKRISVKALNYLSLGGWFVIFFMMMFLCGAMFRPTAVRAHYAMSKGDETTLLAMNEAQNRHAVPALKALGAFERPELVKAQAAILPIAARDRPAQERNQRVDFYAHSVAALASSDYTNQELRLLFRDAGYTHEAKRFDKTLTDGEVLRHVYRGLVAALLPRLLTCTPEPHRLEFDLVASYRGTDVTLKSGRLAARVAASLELRGSVKFNDQPFLDYSGSPGIIESDPRELIAATAKETVAAAVLAKLSETGGCQVQPGVEERIVGRYGPGGRWWLNK
jgi:hypothetical protein